MAVRSAAVQASARAGYLVVDAKGLLLDEYDTLEDALFAMRHTKGAHATLRASDRVRLGYMGKLEE